MAAQRNSPGGSTQRRASTVTFRLGDALFFNSRHPLETNYPRMRWTDLHQIFRIGTHMGGLGQSDLLFTIAQGTLLW